MTIVRLGYVALSMKLKGVSPSKTMTFKHFSQLGDRDAAIRKLERLTIQNLDNTLRILRHNRDHDIHFYRFTSRIVPLATHEDLEGWNYLTPIKEKLLEVGEFVKKEKMRIDFHPDHFVLINSPKKEVFINSLKTLKLHYVLLKGMKLDSTHRCVMHVGGKYGETELSLERFVENWMNVPRAIQKMIMLENDDKSFTVDDTLYLCEKLDIPLVFDYHHHLANHVDERWQDKWERIVKTWEHSPFSVKMHISSPKNEKQFRHHADFVDVNMFFRFLDEVKGSVPQIDCMIEAKRKDEALFQLMEEVKKRKDIEIIDKSTFSLN